MRVVLVGDFGIGVNEPLDCSNAAVVVDRDFILPSSRAGGSFLVGNFIPEVGVARNPLDVNPLKFTEADKFGPYL